MVHMLGPMDCMGGGMCHVFGTSQGAPYRTMFETSLGQLRDPQLLYVDLYCLCVCSCLNSLHLVNTVHQYHHKNICIISSSIIS